MQRLVRQIECAIMHGDSKSLSLIHISQPQMAAMKWMMYLMPIMFLFVLNDYPSGLNYYYFVSTLISVGTMILLRKTTDETKLLAILEAKKKDPKQMKKTGFAARLEAMQMCIRDRSTTLRRSLHL